MGLSVAFFFERPPSLIWPHVLDMHPFDRFVSSSSQEVAAYLSSAAVGSREDTPPMDGAAGVWGQGDLLLVEEATPRTAATL